MWKNKWFTKPVWCLKRWFRQDNCGKIILFQSCLSSLARYRCLISSLAWQSFSIGAIIEWIFHALCLHRFVVVLPDWWVLIDVECAHNVGVCIMMGGTWAPTQRACRCYGWLCWIIYKYRQVIFKENYWVAFIKEFFLLFFFGYHISLI